MKGYYLKLREDVFREIVYETIVGKLCKFAIIDGGVINKMSFLGGGVIPISVQLVCKIDDAPDSDIVFADDSKVFFNDNCSIQDAVNYCKNREFAYTHMCLSEKILLDYVKQYIKNSNVIGLPKKTSNNIKVKFCGELGKDFRCIVVLSNDELNDLNVDAIDRTERFTNGTYNCLHAEKINEQ